MDYPKVPQEINNIVGDNVKLLEQLFPSAVKDGQVDFEALKEELGQFQEVGKEKYELTWAGKQDAKKKAQEDVYNRTLNYIEADSKYPESTENLYIEGDNLEVLKLIRQNYYGAVKIIYIDPPYNTGNDFVYNDNFAMSGKESDIAEGVRDDYGNPLQKNQKSTNRYHANWLNMMYPRLKVAKDLLTDDGVIFISIGQDEIDNMIKICNEILGEENQIGICSRQMKTGSNQGKHFAPNIDYILVYAKNIDDSFRFSDKLSDNLINKVYNKLQKGGERDGQYYRTMGLFQTSLKHGGSRYPIQCPDGSFVITPEGFPWRWNERTFLEKKSKDEVVFIETNTSPLIDIQNNKSSKWNIYTKIWLDDRMDAGQLPKDVILEVENRHATKELIDLGIPFDFPKPTKLLKWLFEITKQKKVIILDFFSGSAACAHAVMKLNASDEGERKFIMVQLPEVVDETSEMYKFLTDINKPTNICELGKERIRRAGEKIKREIETANAQIKIGEEAKQVPDIGFKVFRTANTNIKWNIIDEFDAAGTKRGFDTHDELDFTLGSNDIDVVYEVMLRQNDVPLSSTLETLTDIGSRTYLYGSAYLLCLETNITEELIDKLAALDPLPIKFVFRDSAFKDDINLKDETFRRLKNLIERNSGLAKKSYTVEFI